MRGRGSPRPDMDYTMNTEQRVRWAIQHGKEIDAGDGVARALYVDLVEEDMEGLIQELHKGVADPLEHQLKIGLVACDIERLPIHKRQFWADRCVKHGIDLRKNRWAVEGVEVKEELTSKLRTLLNGKH